jgi:cytochrome c oxidase subunit 2
MISFFVDQSSTYAADVDFVWDLVFWMTNLWALACFACFFYFIIKFRKRDGVKAQYITGEEKEQKKWINIPHALVLVCDVFIIVAAVQVWYAVKQDLPEPDTTIRVVAQQWAWTFQHPGKDNKLDTDDDIRTNDILKISVNKTYHVKLESLDVMHDFSVPVFRFKQDIIPGRVITQWFKAIKTGQHDIQCAEMCGIGHGIMSARIHIQTEKEHLAWINANSKQNTIAAAVAN